MERVLQHLGLTSKKSSNSHQLQSPGAYGAYGNSRSPFASHSNNRASTYVKKKPFSRDDAGWTELSGATAMGSNDSKDQVMGGEHDVVVTTDIEFQVEEGHGGNRPALSHGGPASVDDRGRSPSFDVGRAV